jgi:hypothetical protein
MMAEATVKMNNIDSHKPILALPDGTLLDGKDVYVELYGGPIGGTLFPVIPVGISDSRIRLSQPGYFDAGVGVVPGILGNSYAEFYIRAWFGWPYYDSASYFNQSPHWTQKTGLWDPKSGLVPTGPALDVSASFVVALPEPSGAALGIVGGAALFISGLVKALKTKPVNSTKTAPVTPKRNELKTK